MKQKRAISNVKNPIARRALLALVSPLILLVCLIFVVYSLFTSSWTALKSFGNEFRYDYNQLARIVTAGVELAWMGKDAYYKREDAKEAARLKRMFNRA